MSLPAREVLQTAAQGVPRWQRVLAPAMFPLLRAYLGRRLAISSDTVEAGLRTIAASFDEVAERIADSRAFLCGDQFTAADLSFACMAAPILLPAEYGIRLPALEQAPDSARADILRFRAHPAGQFALRLFAQHRAAPLSSSASASSSSSS
jgi:glutathione S-transferase